MTHQEALNIAGQAWDRVKTDDDPLFVKCSHEHRLRLAYKVESVAKTGRLEDDFDCEAYRILNPPRAVSPVTPIPEAPPAPASETPAPAGEEVVAPECGDDVPIEGQSGTDAPDNSGAEPSAPAQEPAPKPTRARAKK